MKFDYDKRKGMLKKRLNRDASNGEIINSASDAVLMNEFLLEEVSELRLLMDQNVEVHKKMKDKANSSEGLKLKDLEDILKDSLY